MIQQIKNNKTDKQLTQNDLKRITYASGLNLFHTNTMFSYYAFGIKTVVEYHYAKRINANSYQYQMSWIATLNGSSPILLNNIDYSVGSIQTRTMAQIEAKNTNLLSDTDGTERLFIRYFYRKSWAYDKRKLGFYILEPRGLDTMGDIFIFDLVITPKPGLFPVKSE